MIRNMNNQFETSVDLSVPDANAEYYVSPITRSSGITLLMKTVLLYKSHSHLFHSIIQSSSIEGINKTNSEGWTALMIAIRNCNTVSDIECVKLLIEHGADINVKFNDDDGWTALMLACRYCNADSSIECVKLLIEHGTDINVKDNTGWTALMLACQYYCDTESSIECVKLLLQHGADINVKSDDYAGDTALMLACKCCCIECVKLLLEHGADINVEYCEEGLTVLMLACQYCNTVSDIECVKLLLQHGADINVKDDDGCTALMFACDTGSSIEICKLLFEKGGSINFECGNIVTYLNTLFEKRVLFIDDMFEYHQYIPDDILDKLDRCFQFHYYQTGYRFLNRRVQNINDFQQCRRKGIGCTDIITSQYL